MTWRDHAKHPNALRARTYRHEQLTRAASAFDSSRLDVLSDYARGKKALDVGCVSHNFKFQSGGHGQWLHAHVVEAAAECVGADYDEVGVKEMREAGYDVVHADICGDVTPILARGPFDVMIVGEVIEHLPSPQQLLASAREILRPGGQLVITTPNPYAPHRVRQGMRGTTWENVDHITYMFPSGMAELADRTGLVLTRFGTVGQPAPKPFYKELKRSLVIGLRALQKRFKGERDPLSNDVLHLQVGPFWQSPLDALMLRFRGYAMARESAIYVLTKPDDG